MHTKYFFIISIALLFSACASIPVYRISSLEKNKYFDSGREVISKEKDKVKILLNFESQSGTDLVFYLAVYNKSDASILIDPSAIYAEIKKAKHPGKINNKIFVTDPEVEIEKIDKEINQTNSDQSLKTGIHVLESFANLAESIATIGKNKTDEQIEEENRTSEDLQNSIDKDKTTYDEKMYSLNEQKNYWGNDVLRKTTLRSNENISGYFHLHVNSNIFQFNLIIPIENDKFGFQYKLLEK